MQFVFIFYLWDYCLHFIYRLCLSFAIGCDDELLVGVVPRL